MSYATNYNLNARLSYLENLVGSGSLPTTSPLVDVLNNGNNAGTYDINMNNQNILQVTNIDVDTINGNPYPPVVASNNLTDVLNAGNTATNSISLNNTGTGTNVISLLPNSSPTNPAITLTDGTTTNTIDKNGYTTRNTNANLTYYLNFSNSSTTGTGAIQKTSGISCNPSLNSITATTFNGSLNGNASTATTATTATNATNVNLTSDNTSGTYYLPFAKTSGTGNQALYIDDTTTPLTYNPNTSTLTASTFNGSTITSPNNTLNITPTTTETGYFNLYCGNYSTISNGAGTSLQFLATPSSPYLLGNINFLKNDSTLTGSAYMVIDVQNGRGATPLLYGVPTNSSGNANLYPPNNEVNLGVLGGQFSSVGAYSIQNNDPVSALSLYSVGTPISSVGISSWYNQAFVVVNSFGTSFTSTAPGLGFCATTSSTAGYPTWIIAIAPGINWLNLNLGAATTFVHYYGTAVAYTNGSGWNTISDEREKINIKDLDTNHSLQKILACKTKHFNRKIYDSETPIPDEVKDEVCVGLLAQDVLEFNPGCVDTWVNDKITPTPDDDGTRYSLNYHDFTIHLIGAVQEQNKTITALQSQIQEQDAKINALQSQFDELMKKINTTI
jgi:Chaperone of endosialidase